MKLPIISIAGGLAISVLATAATAECTHESVQEKMRSVTTGMLDLATTDSARMQEISDNMQESMAAAAQSDDQEAVCTNLDEIIAELTE